MGISGSSERAVLRRTSHCSCKPHRGDGLLLHLFTEGRLPAHQLWDPGHDFPPCYYVVPSLPLCISQAVQSWLVFFFLLS